MNDSGPQRPRVLMVTGAYRPEISSGGEQCRIIAEELRGRAEVEVLTTSVDPSLARRDEIDGIAVTRIQVDVRSEWSRLRAFRRMAIDLLRLVRGCDIVHLHGYSTKNVLVTFVAKMFRKPIVMSLHTAGYDEPEVIAGHGSLAHWAFLSVDQYLSVSQGLVDSYLAGGMPPQQIHLVPNGIDIQRFAPAGAEQREALRHSLGVAPNRPVIAFVGFFSADKQPRVLFDAWHQLQTAGRIDATLMFVGATESDYFEVDATIAGGMRATAEAAGLSDRLRLAGVTRDVPAYLRAADVFVLPSRREGLPVALLEAMSCGLPCIASRLPGSTDAIVEHGVNGWLTPPGDVDAIARALDTLLHDEAMRARLGNAARETVVGRFASADVADRWLAVYQAVLRRHRS